MVTLSVGDDGKGIAAEHLDKIFDPFFTTRLGEGGSGLGLSIAYGLVTGMLGGRIAVTSAPGQGTTFTLELPLVAPRSAEPGAEPTSPATP
jgi:signal transduction histidine kinase